MDISQIHFESSTIWGPGTILMIHDGLVGSSWVQVSSPPAALTKGPAPKNFRAAQGEVSDCCSWHFFQVLIRGKLLNE